MEKLEMLSNEPKPPQSNLHKALWRAIQISQNQFAAVMTAEAHQMGLRRELYDESEGAVQEALDALLESVRLQALRRERQLVILHSERRFLQKEKWAVGLSEEQEEELREVLSEIDRLELEEMEGAR